MNWKEVLRRFECHKTFSAAMRSAEMEVKMQLSAGVLKILFSSP